MSFLLFSGSSGVQKSPRKLPFYNDLKKSCFKANYWNFFYKITNSWVYLFKWAISCQFCERIVDFSLMLQIATLRRTPCILITLVKTKNISNFWWPFKIPIGCENRAPDFSKIGKIKKNPSSPLGENRCFDFCVAKIDFSNFTISNILSPK